jgi:hypothetical protein
MTTAQVDASVKRGREPGVAGHHQHQPAGPAETGQIAAECGSPRFAVMSQDNAGQAAWQPGHSRTGIAQPALIGEQPQDRQPRSAARRVGPGKQPAIHHAKRA